MALFNWGEKYSVGVQSIDDQHKNLFSIVNELHDTFTSKKSDTEIIKKTLDELVLYTQNHFLFEENLLNEHNYPGSEFHFNEHENLVSELKKYIDRFKNGELKDIMDLLQFTIDWLQNHILENDKKYSRFLSARGVK